MKNKGTYLSWIVVDDFEESIDFFTNVVGLKLLEKSPEYKWAELRGEEGAILGICGCNEQMKSGKNAVVTFTVDDIDQAKAEMISKGATMIGDIIEVPGHVKMQTFSSQGNEFQIVQKLEGHA